MYALSILEDAKYKGFQNVIVNILDMVLEDTLTFFPHALPQVEPNLFIKSNEPLHARVSIPIYYKAT